MSDTITQGKELSKFSNHDDEAQDPSYGSPSKKQRGHITGSRHSLPASVKAELANTALGSCCTLTLDPILTRGTIEIAHVVPRATTANCLHILQEAWHTKEFPDVDSPMNLMYLRVDWHRAFDGELWAMLPSVDILMNISSAMGKLRTAKRFTTEVDLFSEFSKVHSVKYYEYQFLWLGSSDSTLYSPLLRRKDTTISGTSNTTEKPQDTLQSTEPSTRTSLEVENKELRQRLAELVSRCTSPGPSLALLKENFDDLQAKLTAYQDEIAALRSENTSLRAEVDALSAQAKKLLLERMLEHETRPDGHPDSNLASAGDETTELLELALHYRVFHPPYTDFPTFESHVHPFFAIVNAGSKLSGVPNISQFGPLAEAVLDIYQQWFGLPPSLGPPRVAAGEDDGDGDDGQSSRTSQMDESRSSVASGARKTGSRKSGRLAQKAGGAPNAQDRAGDEHAAPCDAVDIPMIDPCHSSAGTPSLVPDSSVNALSSHSLDKAEELEDVDTFVSTWLADVHAAPPQENSGDRTLDEYDQEPSQQAEPHKWQQWAIAPPKMPGLLRDYHDTSKLTSYHWSLYHECVNLMAPTGSHRLPLNVHTPYDPDDVRKYDVWRDDE